MGFAHPVMVELLAPHDDNVRRRLKAFYHDIGWLGLRSDTKDNSVAYVEPLPGTVTSPSFAYRFTENERSIDNFKSHQSDRPSIYARGLRLPVLHNLVEVSLVLPTDDAVQEVFDRGGRTLAAHSHIPPRDHAGMLEFRFADPLNYSLRVTSDPGWEVVSRGQC